MPLWTIEMAYSDVKEVNFGDFGVCIASHDVRGCSRDVEYPSGPGS
jgi:hypothetical protein